MTKRSEAAASRRRPLARRPETRSSARRNRGRMRRLDRDRVWVVSDELPSKIPVLPAEIEVIETYFGALLDELLADHKGGRPGLPVAPGSGTLPGKEKPE
ncbi:hypothetical protein CRBSH125_22760 [Afipia carboxidovorans]|nr:hypothetical protein CRBSH125_22760 [Afipia carboxidovorans]